MRCSQTKEAPLFFGLVAALATWFTWGALAPHAIVEDEVSYVLQSRIFASGHWTAPSPPVAEFFQQAHVLTVPAVASKYPPGNALLMSVGSFFGAPALVPLLLTGLTGSLLFALVRRVTNSWVAVFACVTWLSDPIELRHRPGYFSEVTSSAMWMLALWSLVEWRERRQTRWLLALSAAIAWGAVTRPLSMLAFAVPVGVLVLRDVVRTHLWRDLALAFALGCCFLGLLPLWSKMSTGDWRLSPQQLYTRDYLPYDKAGFGLDSTPPTASLSPVNRFTYTGFRDVHAKHTLRRLPLIARERLAAIAHDEWSGPRLALLPFVAIGLLSMNASVCFALLCSLALFAGYLVYGHWAQWTIYYLEGVPVFSVITAIGIWRMIELGQRRSSLHSIRGTHALALAAATLALLAGYEATIWRDNHRRNARWDAAFEELLNRVPVRSAVVFVHYAPRLGPHLNVVQNSPHLLSDSMWIVNDLGGARDAQLLRDAAGRLPLAFYERDMHIEPDSVLARIR